MVDDEVYFAQSHKSLRTICKSFSRMYYSFEAKRKFTQLLRDTKPDLVYILQYHNKISPSVIYAAKRCGIPVVHRISDFQYICPNALCYNDRIGVCEDCLHGHRLHCIKYKCVLNSSLYSALKAGAKWLHDMLGVTKKVDAFVVPSSFTLSKLQQYGIPADKLHHIPTFYNLKDSNPEVTYESFALFVGRIERQKGLGTLVEAFRGTDMRLKIIGFSNDGYEDELKASLSPEDTNIEFLGKKNMAGIEPYLRACRFTIVPSEWYDNFPNTILESFAFKKAVIATDFGSLREPIKDGENGYTFIYKDAADLRAKAARLFDQADTARQMGEAAFQTLFREYTPDVHYAKIISLFNSVSKP